MRTIIRGSNRSYYGRDYGNWRGDLKKMSYENDHKGELQIVLWS